MGQGQTGTEQELGGRREEAVTSGLRRRGWAAAERPAQAWPEAAAPREARSPGPESGAGRRTEGRRPSARCLSPNVG
jgi:hypothetical protein